MISDKEYNRELLINDWFKGSYIGDEKKNNDGKLLLVYTYDPTFDYAYFSKKLTENGYFFGRYGDKKDLLYMFNIPEDHIDDFEEVIQGRAENISPNLKLKMTKFWGKGIIKNFKPNIEEEIYS